MVSYAILMGYSTEGPNLTKYNIAQTGQVVNFVYCIFFTDLVE